MKEKLIRFMQGRYGADSFCRFLLGAAFLLMLISMFIPHSPFYLLGLLLLIYCYFRIFSKNISKRYQENMVYLKYHDRFILRFKKSKNEMVQRKTHHIYRCPQCHQKIRVPKGRGRIAICCPKCNKEFIKKS